MIQVNAQLSLAEDEILFAVSRSPGPGGQHVNTTDTRVTLRFDVVNSKSLSQGQKARILERLAGRINKDGVLRVTAHAERSQKANKDRALERFVELLRQALKVEKKRRPTRVPLGEKRRRVESKRQRSAVKKGRAKPGAEGE